MAEERRATVGRGLLADWGPAAGILLFHLAFLPGYGVFRDELYYMACGRRPSWGYVDHPPLVGWAAWLVAHVAGESHLALRVVAALAVAATVWLAGRVARALGGGAFARALAGIATGLAPVVLSLGSTYSMNALDLLFWALIALLLVRALSGGGERLWLAFGARAGLGLLNKISVLFLGFGLVVGLVLARRWDVFRSRLLLGGGTLAALLFAPARRLAASPRLADPRVHGQRRRLQDTSLSPPAFLREQPAAHGAAGRVAARSRGRPGSCSRAGPRGPAARSAAASWSSRRAVLTSAKPYYLAPAYSLALAAGAVAVEGFTSRARSLPPARPRRPRARDGLSPRPARQAHSVGRGVPPLRRRSRHRARVSDERHALGRLPQFYADMHGWRELAETVAGVVRGLPPEEAGRGLRLRAELRPGGGHRVLRPAARLPPGRLRPQQLLALGPAAPARASVVVVIGGGRERLRRALQRTCDHAASVECTDCMPYEDELSIWVARGPKQPLRDIWPLVKHYD